MSFTSVLEKISQDVNKFDAAIPIWGELIHAATSMIPGADGKVTQAVAMVDNGLQRAANIIVDVQVMRRAIGASGEQGALMAAPAIAQLYLDLPMIKGRKPKDPEKFKADSARLAGVLADLANNFEG